MKFLVYLAMMIAATGCNSFAQSHSYTIVDTGQIRCYDDHTEIAYPDPDKPYYGQDALYSGNQPSYHNNGDGTVIDLNTGLMWQEDPGSKKTYAQAVSGAKICRTGGYDDWRLPTIKELYSLILFSGADPDPRASGASNPFIDTRYFKFKYGNTSDGERIIDSQWATSTLYSGKVMQSRQAMFGVNFADGRIKGYPADSNPGGDAKQFYVIYVRGNPDYGKNNFVDNGDGTVTDHSTGLTWMQVDSGILKAGSKRDGKLNWQEALAWAENLTFAAYSDWRLPNAKELQSIVDYTRSPDTTQSAAINPVFMCTPIVNEGGQRDFSFYWTGTTHASLTSATQSVYIAFGRALGFMLPPKSRNTDKILMDVHGAGAQRSDPKSGDPSMFPTGRGPQGDVIRIYNMVRCVRGGAANRRTTGPKIVMKFSSVAPESGSSGRKQPTGLDFVHRLDQDGDGMISRQEFDGPSEHFTDFDHDGDGYISAEEAPIGPPPDRNPGKGGPPSPQ